MAGGCQVRPRRADGIIAIFARGKLRIRNDVPRYHTANESSLFGHLYIILLYVSSPIFIVAELMFYFN